LPAQWLDNTGNVAERATAVLQQVQQGLAQPSVRRLLRRALLGLLALWGVLALVQLFWALWPQPPAPPPAEAIINPVTRNQAGPEAASVDIGQLAGWDLFGAPGIEAEAEALASETSAEAAGDREGIEKGARETRLDLTLRGVVADSEDGLGHAIIEYRNRQEVYAVDDELPVSGNVKLAKVMPRQVVLDNNGTYELLRLFEENEFDAQLRQAEAGRRPAARPVPDKPGGEPPAAQVDKREDARASELAAAYRERLYENPQSLAALVRIDAVREGDGALRGYRVMPGRDAVQFGELGFKAGDLVTSINGITLNDPANTMQVYQTMRTASEAVFELQRNGEPLSLSVNLESGTP
jgi:general secretion pathway protein C